MIEAGGQMPPCVCLRYLDDPPILVMTIRISHERVKHKISDKDFDWLTKPTDRSPMKRQFARRLFQRISDGLQRVSSLFKATDVRFAVGGVYVS